MIVIKKMDALSLAKIQGLIGVVFGAIMGIFAGIISMIADAMMTAILPEEEAAVLPMFNFSQIGWLGLILFPIIYGIMFFVLGLISAWLYNLAARFVGGMKIEVEDESQTSRQIRK